MSGVTRMESARIARWVLPLAALAALCGCGGGGGGTPTSDGSAARAARVPGLPAFSSPPRNSRRSAQSPRTGHRSHDRQGLPGPPGHDPGREQLAALVDPSALPLVRRGAGRKSRAVHHAGLLPAHEDDGDDVFRRTEGPVPLHVPDLGLGVAVPVGRGSRLRSSVRDRPGHSAAQPSGSPICSRQASLPSQTVAANLVRGDTVLQVDGVDVVNATDQTSINTINAGLAPSTAGETTYVRGPRSGLEHPAHSAIAGRQHHLDSRSDGDDRHGPGRQHGRLHPLQRPDRDRRNRS